MSDPSPWELMALAEDPAAQILLDLAHDESRQTPNRYEGAPIAELLIDHLKQIPLAAAASAWRHEKVSSCLSSVVACSVSLRRMSMGTKKRGEGRVVIAASIAFVCACGARSEFETTGPVPAGTTSSCHDDGGAGGEAEVPEVPGCVLHASNVSGADLGPTTLTIPESLPGTSPIEGYWTVGWALAIVGKAGDGRWFQLWSHDLDALACGKPLPLVPTMNEAGQNHVLLRWATSTADWTSASGTLDVVAYEPGVSVEQQPIHIKVHGASMAPRPAELGNPSNDATGTFTADLSCRLEKFWHIPPN
ncbi:hypothetical protein [Polyangium jinanense]|uniref:Uncharacterized protein n=1 Tax=Polyangium jinanense TaxID=2829994 RepID=A0A9X3XCM2_9BACT|nr:hypothetical protein [Polyangium jinanense]MDC3961718.1 hypothetical protein [Polyangium jinanense]MDC3988224.1 hypothetical protein [Polyangium jinanense]